MISNSTLTRRVLSFIRAHVAAQLSAFAAGERERRYLALRLARRGLTLRGTWLTDKGLAEAGRLEAKR